MDDNTCATKSKPPLTKLSMSKSVTHSVSLDLGLSKRFFVVKKKKECELHFLHNQSISLGPAMIIKTLRI